MGTDANGEIYVSGLAGSSDLPGLSDAPSGCQPSVSRALEFVARIPAGPPQTVAAHLVCGAPISCLNSCGGAYYGGTCLFLGGMQCALVGPYSSWPTAVRPDGRAVVAGANGAIAAVGFLNLPPIGLRHGPVR